MRNALRRPALRPVNVVSPTPYDRLVVTPEQSKRHPDRVVAFIGKQLCFFEKNCTIPPIGQSTEVMITRALYRRNENGYYDRSQIIALVIRPVTDADVLVEHNGFECAGTMCRTTANARLDGDFVLLTPGRTDIWVADNVNSRFYGNDNTPRRPGYVWILRENDGIARVQGLARVEDAEYADHVRR